MDYLTVPAEIGGSQVPTGEFLFLRKIFFMLIISFRALYTRNHTEIGESEV